MVAAGSGPTSVLEEVGRVRAHTRLYRSGHWFASMTFGVVILGALPFYVQSTPARTPHCPCASSSPLGRAFEPGSGSARHWADLYWAVAVVIGFAAVVGFYHFRGRMIGVQGPLWPAVVAGLVLLGAVMWVDRGSNLAPLDFWRRGTSALVVIALGFCALSLLERDRPFMVFVVGFLALALLACLYNMINVFYRLGIAAPFRGNNSTLPNLIVPAVYLIVGGFAFFLARGRRLRAQMPLARDEAVSP